MAEHIVNDRKVVDGQMVRYTAPDGSKHDAVVKKVHAVYHADLETRANGGSQFVEGVPFGADGGSHSWDHIPEDEAKEAQKGNVDEQAKDSKSKRP